ncbi:NADH dehydrogenase 1 beta subcomplex subunit 3 [Flagelloscypha sp. PMI_526]|nr:NADH dehydrogenase 1 beta subcomplex subunit 3 [Flagelloscypha sp. PMI_526]
MPGPVVRDRWARNEAWRKHPVFQKRAMFANILPGFGTAVVVFTAYVIADNFWLSANKKDDHGHH